VSCGSHHQHIANLQAKPFPSDCFHPTHRVPSLVDPLQTVPLRAHLFCPVCRVRQLALPPKEAAVHRPGLAAEVDREEEVHLEDVEHQLAGEEASEPRLQATISTRTWIALWPVDLVKSRVVTSRWLREEMHVELAMRPERSERCRI
jgi:hypothetical protein